MWGKQEEDKFQALLKKYTETPKAKENAEDSALVHLLINEHLETGNINCSLKIAQLLEVFLKAALKGKKLDLKILSEAQSQGLKLAEQFEFFLKLSQKIRVTSLKMRDNVVLKHTAYVEKARLTGTREANYLSPNYDYFHLKEITGLSLEAVAGLPASPLVLLPYVEMLKGISLQQRAKYPELDFSEEEKALLEATYQAAYARSLSVLPDLYERFAFQKLWRSCFVAWNQEILYPDLKLHEILPLESLLRTFLPLSFKQAIFKKEEEDFFYKLHVLLMGHLIVEEQPEFKGWQAVTKDQGKEHGFILVSPDKKLKLYAKYTKAVYQEYFAAKVLSHLSLKMAEPLLILKGGVPFLLTRDLSREYQKNNQVKSKTFQTMAHLIKQPTMYSFTNNKKDSKEDLESTQQFLKKFSEDPTMRLSFAKTLLAGLVFGLDDLGCHGGNIGLITTKTLGKPNRYKIGIVDFSFYPVQINSVVGDSVVKYFSDIGGGRMSPIFQEMCKYLNEQDFSKALDRLQYPEVRTYSKEGFLLLQKPNKSLNRKEVIEEVYKSFTLELSKELPDLQCKAILEKISQSKELIESNFQYLSKILKPIKKTVEGSHL
jgi:hypothetical protein